MTLSKIPLAISAAALAILVGSVAAAEMKNAHVLTVRLPDGTVERIRYSGDVAPEVSLRPAGAPLAFVPAADLFDAGSPFAEVDRVFADMDRQAESMLRQAEVMRRAAIQEQAGGPRGLMQAGFGALPAGVSSYSVVTTIEGGKACTRTVEFTGNAAGGAPKVLTSSSGDCRAAGAPATPTVAPGGASPTRRAPGLVQASYRGDAATSAGAPAVAAD